MKELSDKDGNKELEKMAKEMLDLPTSLKMVIQVKVSLETRTRTSILHKLPYGGI